MVGITVVQYFDNINFMVTKWAVSSQAHSYHLQTTLYFQGPRSPILALKNNIKMRFDTVLGSGPRQKYHILFHIINLILDDTNYMQFALHTSEHVSQKTNNCRYLYILKWLQIISP